jgi:hypothetical protein
VSGVKKNTFLRMIDILKKADLIKKKQGDRPNTVSMADRLLMTLEYLGEYGTYFHVASSYGARKVAATETSNGSKIHWSSPLTLPFLDVKLF